MTIQAEALNNIILGGPNANIVSIRFQAKYALPVVSARTYHLFSNHPDTNSPGYARGTRGTMDLWLCADANGVPGDALSGAVWIADRNYPSQVGEVTPGSWEPVGAFPLYCFPSLNKPMLVAGSWYHLLWTNVDTSPEENYSSLDFLWHPTVLNQTPDMQVMIQQSGAWRVMPDMIPSPVAIFYADGSVQGYAGYQMGLNGTILNGNEYGFPESLNV